MDVPGIEHATLWLVVRHANPYTNDAVILQYGNVENPNWAYVWSSSANH